MSTDRQGSFNSAYQKLVEALRELRDKHNMDPARIAQQAALTLSKEKHASYDRRTPSK